MLARWLNQKALVAVAAIVIATAGTILGLVLTGNSGASTPARHATGAGRQLVSPFTGEPVRSLGPVLAVKIDNIVYARPQTGLTSADIVYVLPVEGGLSRFLAVFSSHLPPVIGPVRSAREDDLELLRQFGRPAFAFSGAQPQLLPVVEHSRIIDLYSGLVSGYYRGPGRIAPYNLFARTAALLAEAKGASRAHSIGFTFGPAPAGGRVTPSMTASYSSASFTFRWSAPAGRWLVWMDGRRAASTEGPQLSAATVVIQYTTVRTSRFLEQGRRPPYAETTGSGTAVVLRNGRAFQARWSRPSADGGTAFTTGSGQPMPFAPGQVWIVLMARP
jgi:Protein of unknown function (DUF3048) N-terminal domain/Protein of unknown function (DUF3048) C-terminal domain